MRKIIPLLLLALMLLGLSFGQALAQEDVVSDTGITPDSPFYFVDSFWKSVRLTFTFNKVRKIERRMEFAEERLAEAEEMNKENKVEAMQKALDRYSKQIQRAEEKIEDKTELADRVAERTAKHLKVLERVIDKAPEAAKDRLEKALESSENGHFRAIEILEKTDIRKARELSSEGIEHIRARIEKQIQEKKEWMEESSEKLEVKIRNKTGDDVDDAEMMLKKIKEHQSLDFDSKSELLRKLNDEKIYFLHADNGKMDNIEEGEKTNVHEGSNFLRERERIRTLDGRNTNVK